MMNDQASPMQRLPSPNQNIAQPTAAAQRKILVFNPEYNRGKLGYPWVFGPNYRVGEHRDSFRVNIKKQLLCHVLLQSNCLESDIMNAIEGIKAQIKAAYAGNVVTDLNWPEVQRTMAEDGCLFLVMAFSILGADFEPKFLENHPVFGTGCVTAYMGTWLNSMFFVGNQIPFILLEKLMDLSFFKNPKTKLKCKQQLELVKRTLHKFLIVDQNPKPVDLFHCLQSIMLGPEGYSNIGVAKKDDDIGGNVTATHLCQKGITMRKLGGNFGIRQMRFEVNTFGAVLHLPELRVDSHTELLMECLLKYEIVQERQGFEPEVITFFKFLGDLIPTSQDIEVLVSEEVVQGHSTNLQSILKNLDYMVSNGNMHSIKRKIVGYRPCQWRKLLKWMGIIVTILTLVFGFMQMNYGILSYYKQGNP